MGSSPSTPTKAAVSITDRTDVYGTSGEGSIPSLPTKTIYFSKFDFFTKLYYNSIIKYRRFSNFMEKSCSACAYRNYLGDEHPCIDCDDNRCNFEPMKKTNEYKLKSANRNKMIAMLLGLIASARFYDNDDECLNFLNN